MRATHNKSFATEESLRFTSRDLAAPILIRDIKANAALPLSSRESVTYWFHKDRRGKNG
jgi:hypothetical protein